MVVMSLPVLLNQIVPDTPIMLSYIVDNLNMLQNWWVDFSLDRYMCFLFRPLSTINKQIFCFLTLESFLKKRLNHVAYYSIVMHSIGYYIRYWIIRCVSSLWSSTSIYVSSNSLPKAKWMSRNRRSFYNWVTYRGFCQKMFAVENLQHDDYKMERKILDAFDLWEYFAW